MTTSPVLPPDTPLVGGQRMTPQWWRWFRDLGASVQSTDDNAAQIQQNADDIAELQATPVKVSDVALTTGTNVVAHGLGAVPSSWWLGRPRGAFPSGGGGGSTVYPEVHATGRSSYAFSPPTSTVITHTMEFTPTSGRVLIGVFARVSTGFTIQSITQTGVTWTLVGRQTIGVSSECWVGNVTGPSSTSVVIDYGSGAASSAIAFHSVTEFDSITNATPRASATVYGVSLPVLDRSLIRSGTMFGTPPVSAAGDLAVFVMDVRTDNLYSSSWPLKSVGGQFSSTLPEAISLYARPAYQDAHIPFDGYVRSTTGGWVAYMMTFEAGIASIGGGGTTPHGLREISIDDTNLTVESVSDVTVDFFFERP